MGTGRGTQNEHGANQSDMAEANQRRQRQRRKRADFVDFEDPDVLEYIGEVSRAVLRKKEYVARAILEEKKVDGRLLYLVDWLPEGVYEPTWEPSAKANAALKEVWELQKRSLVPPRCAPEAPGFDLLVQRQTRTMMHRFYGILKTSTRTAANESNIKQHCFKMDMDTDVFAAVFKDYILPGSTHATIECGTVLRFDPRDLIALFAKYAEFKW